ncbi:hypothetical protein [Algivirga pacifica]|uniref:DUF4145 domain-containing protein n=1 Tax=Algivirga pacifica TaxID=1162670 RepID=A0ABP9DF05_9BACT
MKKKWSSTAYSTFFKEFPFVEKNLSEAVKHQERGDIPAGLLKMRLLLETLMKEWSVIYGVKQSSNKLSEQIHHLKPYLPDYVILQFNTIRLESNVGVHAGNEQFLAEGNIDKTIIAMNSVIEWYYAERCGGDQAKMTPRKNSSKKMTLALVFTAFLLLSGGVGSVYLHSNTGTTQVYRCGTSKVYHNSKTHAALTKRCTKEIFTYTVAKAKDLGLRACKCPETR